MSTIPLAAVHEKAWIVRPGARLEPTTIPVSFTASALLEPMVPNAPRSTIPPAAVHEKAWRATSPASGTFANDLPVVVYGIRFAPRTAESTEVHHSTGGRPRKRVVRVVARSCSNDLPIVVYAVARLWIPPRVPRSTIPPAAVHENACSALSPVRKLTPTTCPLSLTPTEPLVRPAESAEVHHSTGSGPREGVPSALTNDLAVIVYGRRLTRQFLQESRGLWLQAAPRPA